VLLAVGGWVGVASLRPAPPVITSIVPSKAEPGQTVTIAGTALGTDAADLVVRFGDRRGPVTSAGESSVAATVPADLANMPAGDIRVVVEARGMTSNALFMSLARYPRITSVEPEVALPGDVVVVKGDHLDGEAVAVRIGGFPAEVQAGGGGGEGLRVKVPEMPVIEGRAVPVDVALGRETARPGTLVLGHLPLVTAIAPTSGEPGTTVTIKGYGFGPRAADNRVTFGALEALVLSAGPREIQVAVPASGLFESRTPLAAVVTTGGARSAPAEFTAVRSSGDVFRPRFAALPAPGGDPERHAVVGTEIGPVLVLTGRADAASTGERAARAAARLNALMLAASSRPVPVEAQEGPTRITAGGTPIVAVTAEDAEALSRGFAGVPGTRIGVPALARYWAALLNDYLGLFGQRLRPNRAIDFTPRARVLLEMYSDAARRGGSDGVSMAVVAGLSPERLDALRRLAGAPEEGRGAGGLALAGGWEGSIEDGGPPRSVRLQIRADGGRLAGAMTSTAGGVAMGIPLQDLSYDKGMVRFSAVLAGAPRRFRGAIDGAMLSGTVHSAEGAPATGRFSLRHVE
jgi:hypothetical protein